MWNLPHFYLAYEIVTAENGLPSLRTSHIGSVIEHRKGGRAKITAYRQTDHGAEVRIKVKKFQALTYK